VAQRSSKRSKRHDWKKARRLYELEHKSLTEIGEIIGARRETVSKYANRQAWKRADIAHDALERATERAAARVAELIGPQVLDNLQEAEHQRKLVLQVNARILEGLVLSVSPSEAGGTPPTLIFGPGSSPDLTLRRCALNIATATGKPDGEGSGDGGGDEDSSANAARLQADLDELEEAGR